MQAEFSERRERFGADRGGGGEAPSDMGRLWYLDGSNRLAMARVRTGATDGLKTEVAMDREIQEGMRVITGTSSGSSASKTVQSQQSRGFGPPGPPGGRGIF